MLTTPFLGLDLAFFSLSCSGVQALGVGAQVQNLENPHNANLRTLGVLYSLLLVEEQGAQPRAPKGTLLGFGSVCSPF